jgi:hypothetical protein
MCAVHRLAGDDCTHFQRGRCTRNGEAGRMSEARCNLLEARRRVGANTLDRLERLQRLADPADREVARRLIINKNIEAITHLTCPGFVPAGGEGPLCLHQHLVYCLLELPPCDGRCRDFLRRKRQMPAWEGA